MGAVMWSSWGVRVAGAGTGACRVSKLLVVACLTPPPPTPFLDVFLSAILHVVVQPLNGEDAVTADMQV